VSDLLHNFIAHARQVYVSLPIDIHCLDSESLASCWLFTGEKHGVRTGIRCVRASCCSASQGRVPYSALVRDTHQAPSLEAREMELRREATLAYKFQAALDTLINTREPVILLDLDALVLRRECFDEWLAHPEDVVLQVGGAPGCPSGWPFKVLGVGLNSGAMLIRPSAAWLLSAALSLREQQQPVALGDTLPPARVLPHSSTLFPYVAHCYEQELLVFAVLAADPLWRRFPFELSLMLGERSVSSRLGSRGSWRAFAPDERHTPRWQIVERTLRASRLSHVLSMRMLNYSRWAGGPKPIRITSGLLGRSLHSHNATAEQETTPRTDMTAEYGFKPAQARVFPGAGGVAYSAAQAARDSLCLFHAVDLGARRVEHLKRLGLWYLK